MEIELLPRDENAVQLDQVWRHFLLQGLTAAGSTPGVLEVSQHPSQCGALRTSAKLKRKLHNLIESSRLSY